MNSQSNVTYILSEIVIGAARGIMWGIITFVVLTVIIFLFTYLGSPGAHFFAR